MVVYLIWESLGECGEGRELIGVYASEERAEARIMELGGGDYYYEEWQVSS